MQGRDQTAISLSRSSTSIQTVTPGIARGEVRNPGDVGSGVRPGGTRAGVRIPAWGLLVVVSCLAGAPAWSQSPTVGYYDMVVGAGNSNQAPSIVAAGATPVLLDDLTEADLAGIDVLYVQNPSNSFFGGEYLSRLASIEAAVEGGMRLVLHDRLVTGVEAILPGGSDIAVTRSTSGSDAQNIDIVDDTTLVTDGPGGILDDESLDGGNSSSHGFANVATLPPDAITILSRPVPTQAVTFCYRFGSGAVVYSTIPLDFYLPGPGSPPAFSQIYAPNVVAYGADGACAGPPTPPIDASDEFPFELFGSPLSTIASPRLAELNLDPGGPLVGRADPLSLVLQLSAGAFAFPLPSAGPAGSGSDLELGPAFAGWSIGPAAVAESEDELIYELTPGPGAPPVGAGLALSIQPRGLRVSDLDQALDEPELLLSVDLDFEEPVGGDVLQSFSVGIVSTVEGVVVEGADTVADPKFADDEFFYRSEVISIGTAGVCSGFPDGGLFQQSRNCSDDDLFELDRVNDRVRVVVSGNDIPVVLASGESTLALHAGDTCDLATRIEAVSGPIFPNQTSLTFSLVPAASPDPLRFSVCLFTTPSFTENRMLSVEVSVDFSSIFLREPSPRTYSMELLTRCFGDLNEDRIVNNSDLLRFRSCFPCTGPGCDRRCDANADGNVNNLDILELFAVFGSTCPAR